MYPPVFGGLVHGTDADSVPDTMLAHELYPTVCPEVEGFTELAAAVAVPTIPALSVARSYPGTLTPIAITNLVHLPPRLGVGTLAAVRQRRLLGRGRWSWLTP